MIFGDPYKFAILAEQVPTWSCSTYRNGLVFYFIDGLTFPLYEDLVVPNTTLNVDLSHYIESFLAWKKNPQNHQIFAMPKEEAFKALMLQRNPWLIDEDFDDENFVENYEYSLTSLIMEHCGYCCFLVGSGHQSRILVGKHASLIVDKDGSGEWVKIENPKISEVFMEHTEVMAIFNEMIESLFSKPA